MPTGVTETLDECRGNAGWVSRKRWMGVTVEEIFDGPSLMEKNPWERQRTQELELEV